MGRVPQNLSSQIDGIKTVFNTQFARDPGRTTLVFNGDVVDPAAFSEPNTLQIQTTFTPQFGDILLTVYNTDQTFDGRVRGFPDDPTGLGLLFPQGLVDLLDDIDGRLDQLEASQVGAPKLDNFAATLAQTVFTLQLDPILTQVVILFFGGIGYTRENNDFTLTGVGNRTLTWINTDVSFLANDRVEIVYFSLG